jgi:hypothetical protein
MSSEGSPAPIHSALSKKSVIALWLLWILTVMGFQQLTSERFDFQRPDFAIEWTADETRSDSHKNKPYLLDPFLNKQVSWDSEFYLSIAMKGYDDPAVGSSNGYSLNYGFFPLYPYLMRGVSLPLSFLGLRPIATATLAGVIISCIGTLFALLALVDLAGDTLDSAGQMRAAFYLLAFPSSFFLLSVYTEGLFLALTLWSLAFLRREQWLLSGALAFFAVLTRPTGIAVLIPMFWGLLSGIGWRRVVAVSLPVAAFLVWRHFNGEQFGVVEGDYFGRSVGMLAGLQGAADGWKDAVNSLVDGQLSQSQAYYAMEFAAVALGIFSGFAMMRRYTSIALFSFGVIFMSVISAGPEGLIRYALGMPVIFLFLATAGRNAIFDRSWTMLSVLMLGLLAALFAADMWVG